MGGRLTLVEQVEPESAGGKTPGAEAGVWLLLAGIALTCTGVGAIVGIPLVVLGLAMPRARRTAAGTAGAGSEDDELDEPAAPARSRGVGAGTAS